MDVHGAGRTKPFIFDKQNKDNHFMLYTQTGLLSLRASDRRLHDQSAAHFTTQHQVYFQSSKCFNNTCVRCVRVSWTIALITRSPSVNGLAVRSADCHQMISQRVKTAEDMEINERTIVIHPGPMMVSHVRVIRLMSHREPRPAAPIHIMASSVLGGQLAPSCAES
ncbi:uncharacterized protein PHALS_13217 [Plasmopara halstedii]|uniref:Uncharacterized protein n=1 Tax=Plasmopara halstedii TaxID=4781 RepID=A0A0P1AP87_PLAHL|nr:uncharacterized protein PHALS_13217 [Plasmopara halstedii]CEG42988.1 hypothetical protein PHALS_13217 [Plasmopara halstedii]|eukprot:XP_024579357.1 hypothetical protein PHALS_13217 [Plasmopara halstedii]